MISPSRLSILRLLEAMKQERSYFARFIDEFRKMPAEHQAAFIQFLAETFPEESWVQHSKDDTQYIDIIRTILFRFSGKVFSQKKEPCKHDLSALVAEYMKSKHFAQAEQSLFPSPKNESRKP